MHPVVKRAGTSAELPAWARCSPGRRAHGVRVGDLLETWATRLRLPETERIRWRAAGVLHDALKDAPLAEQREEAGGEWPDLKQIEDRWPVPLPRPWWPPRPRHRNRRAGTSNTSG